MPPKKLGNDFKTIKIKCVNDHEVARYRKPRAEWGHQTHKLWLVEERLGKLVTEPPILQTVDGEPRLSIPELDTEIVCGSPGCELQIGQIAMVKGTVAIELKKTNLRPTKG